MRRIATIDLETDPFKAGQMVMPFAAGFYDGQTYRAFWGDDCIKQLLDYLRDYQEPLVIYAHNGGKFDYWYLAHAISEPLQFIDSRLVKARLFKHELRDSVKILPMRLADYQKDEIDYDKMKRSRREKHKREILDYLRNDCVYLFDIVAAFRERFGDCLTIGGAAMRELKKCYEIEHLTASRDAEFRPYFHGGRCQAFEIGELTGDWKLYDVNSMYPHVMAEYQHPRGLPDYSTRTLPDRGEDCFYLAQIVAESKGALPVRDKGLHFPHGVVESFCTCHEIRAALELNLIKILEIKRVHVWQNTRNFRGFVTGFNAEKIAAEKSGDKMGRLFSKLIMNNAYGKFAQNPERFRDFKLFSSVHDCEQHGYEYAGELDAYVIGQIPARAVKHGYFNVATAASITGAARTVLMRALHAAKRPVYCDTDSIIALDADIKLDNVKLGAWKIEAKFDTIHIAGKKLYAASNGGEFYVTDKSGKRKPLKCASKGVDARPEQIAQIAQGETLTFIREAPSLRIGQSEKFITRRVARADKRR